MHYTSFTSTTTFARNLTDRMASFSRPVRFDSLLSGAMTRKTFDEISMEHKKYREIWLSSALREKMEIHVRITNMLRIAVVCFGLSNFQHPPSRDASRAHAQHLAALTMASILQEHFDVEPFPVIAQDPAYCGIDEDFLRTIGVIPVRDPQDFLETTESTLVFTVYPKKK